MTCLEKIDIYSFSNRALPSDLLIATPGLLGEHINIIKCFKDKNSNDITLDDIYQSNIDLMDFGFMTKQAILFFLPSFMKIIIESDLSEEIELIYVVINGCLLKPAEDKKLREEFDLYEFYNKKELNLIAQFLVWLILSKSKLKIQYHGQPLKAYDEFPKQPPPEVTVVLPSGLQVKCDVLLLSQVMEVIL